MRVPVWLTVILLVLTTAAAADDSATQPASDNQSQFILGRAVPQDLRSYTPQDLENLFPAFKHRPFDSAGFSALMLPLLYVDHTGHGDPAEALAFSFLLSNDIDWSPASYCARHAFFVFKHSDAPIESLVTKYDTAMIKNLIHEWDDTQAVGGTITKEATGYAGNLTIFDVDGAIAFSMDYQKPQSYWDLLGSMGVDAMTFLDEKPPDAVAAYLHLPRCKHWESIAALGRAAFLPGWSDADIDAYKQIVDTDPDFAEIRYWYGNQRHWLTSAEDSDPKEYQRQLALALKSRLTRDALGDFHPNDCPDPQLAALAPTFLNQARALLGPDSPSALTIDLNNAIRAKTPSPQLLRRATKVAAKYPDSYNLLTSLANAYWELHVGNGDTDMAASLLLACLEDRYQPGGNDGKNEDVTQFLATAYDAGYRDAGICAEASKLGRGKGADWHFFQALTYMGRFQDVITIAGPRENPHDHSVNPALAYLAFSAAMVGDRQMLDRCLADPNAPEMRGLRDALQYCSDRLAGKDTSHATFGSPPGWEFGNAARVLIMAEDDLSRNEHKHRADLYGLILNHPQVRLGWILDDAYDQQSPWRYGVEFYRTLEWLHPDDPWVVSAVAAYKARSPERRFPVPTTDPDTFLPRLKDFDAPPNDTPGGPMIAKVTSLGSSISPWHVCSDVRLLVEESRFDDARLLARRYRNIGIIAKSYDIAGFANHLLYRIDQLQAEHDAATN